MAKYSDQGWVEYLGGQGLISNFKIISLNLDSFNILNIKTYIYIFALNFILILLVFALYLNSLKLKHYIEAVGIMSFIFK